jgi:hypothetical protein
MGIVNSNGDCMCMCINWILLFMDLFHETLGRSEIYLPSFLFLSSFDTLVGMMLGPMIPISFFLMAGLLVVNGVISISVGLSGYAAYSFIIAALMIIYLYFVRARIPFTKAIMTASAQSLNDFPASIWLSYLFSVLQGNTHIQ